MTKIVLVTGVSGFIGSHLASLANSNGYKVIGLDVVPPSLPVQNDLASFQRLSLASGEPISLLSEFDADYCLHCGGLASVPQSFESPLADFEAGPLATFHLLNEIRKRAPRCRTVFLSSAAVYGNPKKLPVSETDEVAPLSPYGWHKSLSEQVCKEFVELFNMPVAIARIFSAYGPGLRKQVVWDLCNKFSSSKEVYLQGTGTETRDFIHVADIVRALIMLIESGQMRGNVYNLAAGEEIPIKLVAENIRTALGLESVPFYFSGSLPEGTPSRWQADITAVTALGFKAEVPFSTGVSEYVEWWKNESGSSRVNTSAESIAV